MLVWSLLQRWREELELTVLASSLLLTHTSSLLSYVEIKL